ncbi:MAG: hypothetical protein IT384_18370 [Deltaproteobacteria bacterium]|nr:hypothetical protein [Deltaproteobacteria bacterium]
MSPTPAPPLPPEKIAEIKARLREDLEIRRLCKTLGITVDSFLDDIEKQGEEVELFDATTAEERAQTDAEILEAAHAGFAQARANADALAGRVDARAAQGETAKEAGALRAAGRDRDAAAPAERGSGRIVVKDQSIDADAVRRQVFAGRIRGGRA